jgi:hypothetical protein
MIHALRIPRNNASALLALPITLRGARGVEANPASCVRMHPA